MGSEGLEPIGMKAGLLKFIPTIGSADSFSAEICHTFKEDCSGARELPNSSHGAHGIHQADPHIHDRSCL